MSSKPGMSVTVYRNQYSKIQYYPSLKKANEMNSEWLISDTSSKETVLSVSTYINISIAYKNYIANYLNK